MQNHSDVAIVLFVVDRVYPAILMGVVELLVTYFMASFPPLKSFGNK